MASAVHWQGGGTWLDARGAVHVRLIHYPACCSGERAERLSETIGAGTYLPSHVTCSKCKAILKKLNFKVQGETDV